jgi:integrase
MNDEVYGIIMRLRERAKLFRGIESQHYVFPACEHGHFDPSQHQKSFRTAWRSLTRAIQCPACGRFQNPSETCTNAACKADTRSLASPVAGLRFLNLRHHAITELAESQASDQTIMALAGHVSAKMLARYSHVRVEARRQAVAALSARPMGSRFTAGQATRHDTNNDTKHGVMEVPAPQVIENMVGPWGLEPQTSTVSR